MIIRLIHWLSQKWHIV